MTGIEIFEWSDPSDSTFWHIARGHLNPAAFRAALVDRYVETRAFRNLQEAIDAAAESRVFHSWVRQVEDDPFRGAMHEFCRRTDPEAYPITRTEGL